jgi:nitroimidazol reductase NimA-like FMN-containing flavoprotein (pyridoxamine 5'-phosphate oxidase superfamily)
VEPPRSTAQRKQDTLARLERDVDVWVASADADGNAYLVPLSYLWDGATLTVSTPEGSPTGRNLRAGKGVRLALGPTRDVVIIEGTVEYLSLESAPMELADAFGRKLWDVRNERKRYAYYRVTPRRVQAWREENELRGRVVMEEGRWLA